MAESDPHKPVEVKPIKAADDASTQALADALSSSFKVVKVLMYVLMAVFLFSGMFVVNPQEKAVILRLGKLQGTGNEALLGTGLHWAFPAPIDEVIRIKSAQVQVATSTAGWYGGNAQAFGPGLRPDQDGYTLTGDGNIIHVKVTLKYRIDDPMKFYFGFTNATQLVTNDLNNAIFFVSAQYPFDKAVRTDLTGFKEKVLNRVDDLARVQGLGITLEPSDLEATPPRQIKADYDAVITEEQGKSTVINVAEGYARDVLARVSSEAQAVVNTALGESNRMVSATQVAASNFDLILPVYRQNPELYMRQLQVATLQHVLTNVQYTFFVPDRANGKPWELRLQMNRATPKIKPQTPANAADH